MPRHIAIRRTDSTTARYPRIRTHRTTEVILEFARARLRRHPRSRRRFASASNPPYPVSFPTRRRSTTVAPHGHHDRHHVHSNRGTRHHHFRSSRLIIIG